MILARTLIHGEPDIFGVAVIISGLVVLALVAIIFDGSRKE